MNIKVDVKGTTDAAAAIMQMRAEKQAAAARSKQAREKSLARTGAFLSSVLGDHWFKPKPPSKNELKRERKGLAGRWMPFGRRPSKPFEDVAVVTRLQNQHRNRTRPGYRKLTTNLKKLRREMRLRAKSAQAAQIEDPIIEAVAS